MTALTIFSLLNLREYYSRITLLFYTFSLYYHRSLNPSCWCRSNGAKKNSIILRLPVCTSAVTAMPGISVTALPFTAMVCVLKVSCIGKPALVVHRGWHRRINYQYAHQQRRI